MKLNLGCGECWADGWHNVDNGTPYRMDEQADLTGQLPWKGVTHAYLGHVLEHLWVGDALRLLDRLIDCMDDGGEIMVVGPDIKLAQQMQAAGTLDISMEALLYGGRRWPGDEHNWACTSDDLVAMLDATGWSKVTPMSINDVPEQWPVAFRGPQWQCAVSAVAR